MKKETYIKLSGTIFFLVAAFHLLRFINGWEVTLGGWSFPLWLSLLAVIGAGYLSYSALAGKIQ